MTAVAAIAVAALTMGGALTACSGEDDGGSGAETTESASGGAEDTEADAEQTEDTAEEPPAEEEPPADEPPAEDDAAGAGTHAADEGVPFDGDVTITVSAPEPYTPDEYAYGHTEGNTAYAVTVTVENGGAEAYDTDMLYVTARAGDDGVEAEEIFDETMGSGFGGALPPGQTATGQLAFDAPADAATLNVLVEDLDDFESNGETWTLTL
ncbi:DUF4352 domain-containing protein [Streptomyces avicenniae]|uniref:DUF4352 domain-containing protein n=1 Tax=Streptomyces avicenniae TaxID=500153 RepID=UPI00069B9022|nr:DUF4352 domain-containing protein [Streptomyces avicenniae]